MSITATKDRTITDIIAGAPYFDDFDENKRFHRILFRAGYPIQNRELIQLQSILQNQIERFGSHVFTQGAQVIPGGVSYDNNVKWVAITKTGTLDSELVKTINTGTCFVESKVNGVLTGLKAKVHGILLGTSGADNCHLLYIKYISGVSVGENYANEFDPSLHRTLVLTGAQISSSVELSVGIPDIEGVDQIPVTNGGVQVGIAGTFKSDTGAIFVSIAEGIYFAHGYFVKVLPQTFIAEPYDSSTASCKVGLAVTESIETEYDDETLYDNANTRNITAPGAHRLRINLTLTKTNIDTESSDSFIELCRFKNGELDYILDKSTYAYLADELAHRTYDESGDYTVRPFNVITRELDTTRGETLDSEKYVVEIDPGKAYVRGYEVTKVARTKLINDKAQTTKSVTGDRILYSPGNYVFVKNVTGFLDINTPSSCLIDLYKTTIQKYTVTVESGDELDDTSDPLDRDLIVLTSTGIGTASSIGSIIKNATGEGVVLESPSANSVKVHVKVGTMGAGTYWVYGQKNGTKIGTASFKNMVLEDGGNGIFSTNKPGESYSSYICYLYNVQVNTGERFEDVSYIQNSTASFIAHVDHFISKISGTVSISGSTVTGFNTRFSSELVVGSLIKTNDGTLACVATIPSDFSLTLTCEIPVNLVNQELFVLYADLQQPGELDLEPLNQPIVSSASGFIYFTNLVYAGQAVTSNQLSISPPSGGEFVGDFSDNNYFVVIKTVATSDFNYLINTIIDLDPTVNYSLNTGSGVLTISGIPNQITSVDIVTTIRKTTENSRTKTLVTSGEKIITESTEYTKEIFDITDGTNDYDIVELVSVTYGADIDITSRFELDDGVRDGFYTVPKLKRKHGQLPPPSAITVRYKYFSHGSTGDLFSVNSYGISYGSIPEYQSEETGDLYRLTDCLDFRFKFGGSSPATSINPIKPRSDFILNFSHYLPRYDKLCLGTDGKFFIKQGAPSANPIEPEDPQNAMVIYRLKHAAYTKDAEKLILREYVENKRYTMRDIGRLEKRLDNVEYYTSLTLLEKETADLNIVDAESGLTRLKNGFVVDSFTGHEIGDSDGLDYRCSVDPVLAELRPSFTSDAIELNLVEGPSFDADFIKTGPGQKILMLKPLSSVAIITQTLASRTLNVNPYSVFSFRGRIQLNPETDYWKEKNYLAPYVVSSEAKLSIPIPEGSGEVVWGDWETTWTGTPKTKTNYSDKVVGVSEYWAESKHGQKITSKDNGKTGKASKTSKSDKAKLATPPFKRKEIRETRTTTTTPVGKSRTGIKTVVNYSTVQADLGEKLVGVDSAQWIRKREVQFIGETFKPNTRLFAFFDDVDVSAHCYKKDSGGILETNPNNLYTNSAGKIEGSFFIPDSPRFRTGVRTFKLTSDSTNQVSKPDTMATTIYQATGLIETAQKTIMSVRTPYVTTETIVEDTVMDDVKTNVSKRVTDWIDPLSQTFMITDDTGCFVDKIDLWFTSKAESIPVRVQIRNTVNGYPGQVVVPGSDVVVYPANVNLINPTNFSTLSETAIESAWSAGKTTINFEMPVYLQRGEFCFCILSDSNDYNVLVATKSGQIDGDPQVDYRTRKAITTEPYTGSLFKSQNGSTWTAEQESDITFVLYKSQFPLTSKQFTFVNSDIGEDTLQPQPLFFRAGSNKVRVSHKNHGMVEGEKVYITGSEIDALIYEAGTIDNDTTGYVISSVDFDSYVLTVSDNALTSGFTGGLVVSATKEKVIDLLHCGVQQFLPPGTDSFYDIRLTNAGNKITDSVKTTIDANADYIPFRQCIVRNSVNTDDPTVYLDGTVSTTSINLTPVIDLDRVYLMAVQNRISNLNGKNESYQLTGLDSVDFISASSVVITKSTQSLAITLGSSAIASEKYNQIRIGQYIKPGTVFDNANKNFLLVVNKFVVGSVLTLIVDKTNLVTETQTGDIVAYTRYLDEICPAGGSEFAKYTTKKVQLESTSTSVKIMFAAVMPPSCSVAVYLKTQRVDDTTLFDYVPYQLVAIKSPVNSSLVEWKDYEYEVNNLPLFNAMAPKIVMLGGDNNSSWMVPRIKDLRVIALED